MRYNLIRALLPPTVNYIQQISLWEKHGTSLKTKPAPVTNSLLGLKIHSRYESFQLLLFLSSRVWHGWFRLSFMCSRIAFQFEPNFTIKVLRDFSYAWHNPRICNISQTTSQHEGSLWCSLASNRSPYNRSRMLDRDVIIFKSPLTL